uniref:Uncharacterized protein n=1 Tax=uncultured beta proteobacterium HF0130_04F21 TaxID=710819 RepID=E0XSU9_9PROT|nr:hypothetical protein [uncultured beta proteobacterium HF0130_04F21]
MSKCYNFSTKFPISCVNLYIGSENMYSFCNVLVIMNRLFTICHPFLLFTISLIKIIPYNQKSSHAFASYEITPFTYAKLSKIR